MKKIILVSFVLISLASCTHKQPTTKYDSEKAIPKDAVSSEDYYVTREYTYDGCEYVRFGRGDHAWGAHKGNCKNPIHNNKLDTVYINKKTF
jgi:hypothetical protein